MPEVKLSFREKDALAEVASIACGNASAALSSLLGNREVGITTPAAGVALLKDVSRLVEGPNKLVVGIYAPVKGDIAGNVVVVFPKESAFLLADLLKNKKLGTTQAIEEEDQKLISEAGLAVASSYLSALDTFLKMKTSCGDSKFFSSFGESITDFISLGFEEAEEAFLVNSFKTPFSLGFEAKGEFMFMLALKPVDALLKAVRSELAPKEG